MRLEERRHTVPDHRRQRRLLSLHRSWQRRQQLLIADHPFGRLLCGAGFVLQANEPNALDRLQRTHRSHRTAQRVHQLQLQAHGQIDVGALLIRAVHELQFAPHRIGATTLRCGRCCCRRRWLVGGGGRVQVRRCTAIVFAGG